MPSTAFRTTSATLPSTVSTEPLEVRPHPRSSSARQGFRRCRCSRLLLAGRGHHRWVRRKDGGELALRSRVGEQARSRRRGCGSAERPALPSATDAINGTNVRPGNGVKDAQVSAFCTFCHTNYGYASEATVNPDGDRSLFQGPWYALAGTVPNVAGTAVRGRR